MVRKILESDKVRQCISCIIFLAILVEVFCGASYLFRNIGYTNDRYRILDIENEKLDMVYVGGSAAFEYWQPLKAWNDCGFTSYSYATIMIQAESIKYYLKEVQRTQRPDLYVVGLRAFQYWSDSLSEVGIRNGTDSMDLFSPNRYGLVHDYLDSRTFPEDTDKLSFYLDIIKYHADIGNLASASVWGFIDNNVVKGNKGWEWIDSYRYLEEPVGYLTDQEAELPQKLREILIDLLEYCREEKLNVLFVVCPYNITQEDQEKYNAMAGMIEEYGFGYLNTNEYYQEMNIDFATDFMDGDHVNLFGAEKYTEFLEKYIVEHYDMPNHSGELEYASWDESYRQFLQEEEEHKLAVTKLRIDVEKGLEIAEQLRATEDAVEWLSLVDDSRYTVLMARKGFIGEPHKYAEKKLLNQLNIWGGQGLDICVVLDGAVIYPNDKEGNNLFEGIIGMRGADTFSVYSDGNETSIVINEGEYSKNGNGINTVVFDNNYCCVVDSVTLSVKDGEVKVER